MSKSSFPLGASYYPPHHDPQDWARDVAAMAEAGMTCIRSAELLASWDYIEKVRGRPDWDWLDALFDAAHERGLRILLGTGSPNPPIWLLDAYPDAQIVDRDGRPFPTGTVWGWACRNHPGYRAEVERYLGRLIDRYHEHPALWAWQIDNEPGFPFIPRRGEDRPRIHDYNPHTAAAFRGWLQAKYGDPDALNIAWRWDCTHHQYAEWTQVQPPRSMPQEWGVVAAWLDWRTFLYENMAAFVRWQRELIKARDTRHPTMTNIFAFAGCEVEMALDPWLMARQVDAIGYDMYPGIGRRLHREPEYISMFLDMGRSSALHAGAEFWLPELESGPVYGWALGPDYTTTPQDITRYNLEALGHGARAILYQGYREWPCIPIHWGALADFNGQPTSRYSAARQINQMVQDHAELFRQAQPPRAQVAIYYDTRNATLLHGMGAEDLLKRCVRGAYAALWRAGFALEFIDSETLQTMYGGSSVSASSVARADTEEPPYRAILLPAAFLIDAETGAALRRFVAGGGTLIAFAKCGWLDGRGWSWADQPGAGLDELFGVRAGEVERIADCRLQIADYPISQSAIYNLQPAIPGYWHRQPLQPQAGAEALATFDDRSAALVRHRFGGGQTFCVGTHLDAAALDSQPAADLLAWMVEQSGARPPLLLDAPAAVDAHLLVAGERRLVVLTNNSAEIAIVCLELPGFAPARTAELLHGTQVQLEDGAVRLEVAGWDGTVVVLE
jgi:beta-galactosidase GanA